MRELMEEWVNSSQQKICDALGSINQKPCESHPWKSQEGDGRGSANVFKEGVFLEKGGVNVSTISGKIFGNMLNTLSEKQKNNADKLNYFATGMSIVLHPFSPIVPTIHSNYRYFEIKDENDQVISWYFGGGSDLTPYYLYEEDIIHFHQVLKVACDKTELGLYEKLKKEADDYFYLPHRKEHRGIGGIFALQMKEKPQEQIYHWVQNCCNAFLESYLPIVERRIHIPFTENQKKWQLIRRGRYVEFNLLYDVGTEFGLKSGRNTENILMSLPPGVSWEFNHHPLPGSPEEKLLNVIKNPRSWI